MAMENLTAEKMVFILKRIPTAWNDKLFQMILGAFFINIG